MKIKDLSVGDLIAIDDMRIKVARRIPGGVKLECVNANDKTLIGAEELDDDDATVVARAVVFPGFFLS